MKKLQRTSLSQVKKLAKRLAPKLEGGEILGLVGPLGAGKTTFAKALGRALGVKKTMPSPTFVLLHSYQAKLPGPMQTSRDISLYHLDFYRIKSFKEVAALGITELWGKKNSLTLIEWADKFPDRLPKKTKIIQFQH